MIRALLLSATICATNAVQAQEVRCDIKEKFVCEAGGCKSAPAKVWNLIDANKRTYARCDANGCDRYDAQFSQSGVFINVDISGRGVMAKLATDGSSFHEVATIMHAIYVSFGSCKRM